MANFEYYLELYSNNKRMLYRQAYEAAYRDLMGEYEDDLRVQGILIDQLGVEAGTTKKLSSSVSKAEGENKYKRALVAAKVVKQQQDNQEKTRKGRLEARKSVQAEYDISKWDGRVSRIRDDITDGKSSDEVAARREIDLITDEMTTPQKEAFVAYKLGLIVDDFNRERAKSNTPPMVKQQEADRIGVENKTGQQVDADIEKEIELRTKPVTGDKEMTKYQRDFVREGQGAGLDVKQNSDGTFTVGSEIIDKDKLRLTRPTEQDILARAAEYYKPTGSKKFKKGMEEIAVERETQAAADKKAKQELVASMPSWGGQALKYAPEVESLAEEDDKALSDRADTGITLGLQTFASDKYPDIGAALDHINSQNTDDTQKQMALKTYLSRQYRRWRADQDNSVEAVIGDK